MLRERVVDLRSLPVQPEARKRLDKRLCGRVVRVVVVVGAIFVQVPCRELREQPSFDGPQCKRTNAAFPKRAYAVRLGQRQPYGLAATLTLTAGAEKMSPCDALTNRAYSEAKSTPFAPDGATKPSLMWMEPLASLLLFEDCKSSQNDCRQAQ